MSALERTRPDERADQWGSQPSSDPGFELTDPRRLSWRKPTLMMVAAAALWFGYGWFGSVASINTSSERPVLLPADESLEVNSGPEAAFTGFAAIIPDRSPNTSPPPAPAPLDMAAVAAFSRAEPDHSEMMFDNLNLIKGATVRNTNHDGSQFLTTPSSELTLQNHFGPRSDYLGQPAGNPENSFPVSRGGQFRAACEFSHFAYDDPLVFPNQPGASHLHMFFGNTNTNAFTTYDSLINSGSSTCNGQELNRTGYWVPAMFDGQGDVRIPERIVIYYKGEGKARGLSEVYPPGAAMIANKNLNATPVTEGGAGGNKLTFLCTDNFSSRTNTGSQTMPTCRGDQFGSDPARGKWVVMEMNIKFPQCWNGLDPANIDNFAPPQGDWYVSRCEGEFNHTLPNLEYFVNYRVEVGEDTSAWYLASDVSPVTFELGAEPAGSTAHGDWWGGWHPEINRMWIDNCVNYFNPSARSGCGRGYLTDGGPNAGSPYDGPALKIRPQYDGPTTVSAATLFAELCPNSDRPYTKPSDAAYCEPGATTGHGGHGD